MSRQLLEKDDNRYIEGGSAEDYFALWRDVQEALPEWFIDLRNLLADTLFAQRIYETGEKNLWVTTFLEFLEQLARTGP